MDTTNSIGPGTLVHGTNGVVGIVDRIETQDDDPSGQQTTLLIHEADQQRYYRVPAKRIRRVRQDSGQQIAVLDVAIEALDRYQVDRPTGDSSAAWRQAAGTTLRIPVLAEELVVGTRPISLGSVYIHKRVETKEQQVTVPFFYEEATIEHISPDAYDPQASLGPDELIVPIVEEQLFIEKRQVIKEYIRIRKQRITANQDVRETVRREVVEVEERPEASDVVQYAPLYRELP